MVKEQTDQGHSRSHYRDDEIVVDRDGIPHYIGERPICFKEYKKRAEFAFATIQGDGKTSEEQAVYKKKKQNTFASRLVNALHGKAWKLVEGLVTNAGVLANPDGRKQVYDALKGIERRRLKGRLKHLRISSKAALAVVARTLQNAYAARLRNGRLAGAR